MEIQTFILAKQIKKAGPGQYHGANITSTSFWPPDGQFPYILNRNYCAILRRAILLEKPAKLTYQVHLVDLDGRPLGKQGEEGDGMFPAGTRFHRVAGSMSLTLPQPGDYRLEFRVSEQGGDSSLFLYDVEIRQYPEEDA